MNKNTYAVEGEDDEGCDEASFGSSHCVVVVGVVVVPAVRWRCWWCCYGGGSPWWCLDLVRAPDRHSSGALEMMMMQEKLYERRRRRQSLSKSLVRSRSWSWFACLPVCLVACFCLFACLPVCLPGRFGVWCNLESVNREDDTVPTAVVFCWGCLLGGGSVVRMLVFWVWWLTLWFVVDEVPVRYVVMVEGRC